MTLERMPHRGHIGALDGIRGFALLIVFLYHALEYTIHPSTPWARVLYAWIHAGWVGVDLFFVLSGFLITGILLEARGAENYYKVFYARRALRIFPLYYLVMIGSILVWGVHRKFLTVLFFWLNLSNIPTAIFPLLIPYLAHYWSLSIEEQFYLIWPLIVRRVSLRRLQILASGVIVATLVLRNLPVTLMLNHRWPEFVYRFMIYRLDGLAGGGLLAILVYRGKDLARWALCFQALFLASGAAAAFLIVGNARSGDMVTRFGYTSITLCSLSLVALALRHGSVTSRVFSSSFLRLTGRYSYCIYLIHPFFINNGWHVKKLVARAADGYLTANVQALISAAIFFAMSYAVGVLSWHFLETPVLKYKRYFSYGYPRAQPRAHHPIAETRAAKAVIPWG